MILRYYLADTHDRIRLATTGHVEAANDCQPWYFTSAESALDHPAADGLIVHSCPFAETIPGLPRGAVCAEDVLARLDPCALGSIAQEVAKLCAK
jgi:hypothetical protein